MTRLRYNRSYNPEFGVISPALYVLMALGLAVTAFGGAAPVYADDSADPRLAPDASGSLMLKWTAPGDDHYVGRASRYLIRFQTASQGPLDTEAEWAQATVVGSPPLPSLAGRTDSVFVQGLEPDASYYFGLRAVDEVGNLSLISNSPLVTAVEASCCQGRVGDVNGSGEDEPTIGDISAIIDHLFVTETPLWCPAEADINQSGGEDPQQGQSGDITIGDLSLLIEYMFLETGSLPDCL